MEQHQEQLRESTRSSRSQSQSSTSHPASSVPSPSPTAANYDQDVDVAMAIQALGLMRRGSSTDGGTSASSTSSQHRNFQPQPQYQPPPAHAAHHAPPFLYPSATSSSWQTPSSNSTGESSPVGPASLPPPSEVDVDEVQGSESDLGVEGEGDPRFMARVSQLPLVSGGLEWYERSKASSRVVKYGAGLVESSISAVSRPLANNLQLGQLDEFACRQLDRLGAPGGSSSVSSDLQSPAREMSESPRPRYEGEHDNTARLDQVGAGAGGGGGGGRENERGETSELRERSRERDRSATLLGSQQAVAVASRSRWQTVLVEAGGLGAAVSEESLKSLRYCLQWLLYATAHLDHQISILRDFIDSLHRHSSTTTHTDALITASASADLTRIKHDVVETIRKVVDVVSKYAGAALPEQAKRYVKASILGLPVKWASAIQKRTDMRMMAMGRTNSLSGAGVGVGGAGENGAAGSGGATPTSMTTRPEDANAEASGSGTRNGEEPGLEQGEMGTEATDPALRPTEEGAERVLTFAVESLDMLRSVAQIFGESVEKAEAWIERLRIVGLDRQRQQAQARAAAAAQAQVPPPPVIEDEYEEFLGPSSGGYKRRKMSRDDSLRTAEASSVTTAMDLGGASGAGGEEGAVRRKRIWEEEEGQQTGAGAGAGGDSVMGV